MPDSTPIPKSEIWIEGTRYCLAHLDDAVLVVETKLRPAGTKVLIQFSNHCYTEAFVEGVHRESACVMDNKAKRAFCPERYDLSKKIPQMIAALCDAKVFLTPEQNFFQLSSRIDGVDGEYRMFFRVRKARHGDCELRIFVESAYSPDPRTIVPTYRMQKVRFKLVIDKAIEGKKLSFNPKR
ncbi:hypothetical protein [Ponticaulis profundi]|uniref:Uncharacterized protein n=1 Tax=Ponticaulis profundi TaxID=2665222 RepID=A0ABW1SCX1_9PROT